MLRFIFFAHLEIAQEIWKFLSKKSQMKSTSRHAFYAILQCIKLRSASESALHNQVVKTYRMIIGLVDICKRFSYLVMVFHLIFDTTRSCCDGYAKLPSLTSLNDMTRSRA